MIIEEGESALEVEPVIDPLRAKLVYDLMGAGFPSMLQDRRTLHSFFDQVDWQIADEIESPPPVERQEGHVDEQEYSEFMESVSAENEIMKW